MNEISAEDYGEIIEGVIGFLSGDTLPIQRELEARMEDAARDERFEEAARYRNRLFAIRHLAERQAADKRAVGTVDVIGLAVEGDRAAVQVFPLRDGRMIDRYGFHLENVVEADELSVLEAFVVEYYGATPSIPPQVLVPVGTEGTEAIAEFLSERRGSRVEVRTPSRGEKRRLVELASENARVALAADSATREAERLRRVSALEQLRECLNLESLPLRIECFDVSNIQGESIVASMVVFVDGKSKNAHYRTFAMRGLDGQDDVGAIREVISRRFARVREGRAGRELLAHTEPRRRRRRPRPAVSRARGDGGARSSSRGGDLPRQARGGGVRPRLVRADQARAAQPRAPAPAARP